MEVDRAKLIDVNIDHLDRGLNSMGGFFLACFLLGGIGVFLEIELYCQGSRSNRLSMWSVPPLRSF